MRKAKNWDQPCLNKDCSQYDNNNSNIIAISTYMSQNGIRRIFQFKSCREIFSETRDTIKKAQEISEVLLKDLPITIVQLDEMWSFVRKKTKIISYFIVH